MRLSIQHRFVIVRSLLILSFFSIFFSVSARRFVLVLSQDDIKEVSSGDDSSSSSDPIPHDLANWDEFGDSDNLKSDEELDPGSWRPIFEPDSSSVSVNERKKSESNDFYYSAVSKMVTASSSGDVVLMEEAAAEIEAASTDGHSHSRSLLGFLHDMGFVRERSKAKAFLYHYFAAQSGSMQSKMALAYTYSKQDVWFPLLLSIDEILTVRSEI